MGKKGCLSRGSEICLRGLSLRRLLHDATLEFDMFFYFGHFFNVDGNGTAVL